MIRFAMSSTSMPADCLKPRVSMMHSCATRPCRPGVEHRVVRREPPRDVVRVEDRDLGRLGQPVVAHQRDVGPGDRQDRRAAPRRGRDRAAALRVAEVDDRVAGQERREMRRDADRAHARTAAAVRDAEGLVQVEVADVGADIARAAEADLRVHVGAVHVDLPAMLVHDAADLPDAGLEDAVRGRDR